MTCISGGKMAEKSSQEGSGGIPGEQWGGRKHQHRISHSARQMRLITKQSWKNPRNWDRQIKSWTMQCDGLTLSNLGLTLPDQSGNIKHKKKDGQHALSLDRH
jgi:hypothetical protein